tara:strand:- start:3 stop:200 length:198 start_codon:yes stop_codon:yes gene_type:complete
MKLKHKEMLVELLQEYKSLDIAKALMDYDYTYADRVAINLDFELQDKEMFLSKLLGDSNDSKTAH